MKYKEKVRNIFPYRNIDSIFSDWPCMRFSECESFRQNYGFSIHRHPKQTHRLLGYHVYPIPPIKYTRTHVMKVRGQACWMPLVSITFITHHWKNISIKIERHATSLEPGRKRKCTDEGSGSCTRLHTITFWTEKEEGTKNNKRVSYFIGHEWPKLSHGERARNARVFLLNCIHKTLYFRSTGDTLNCGKTLVSLPTELDRTRISRNKIDCARDTDRYIHFFLLLSELFQVYARLFRTRFFFALRASDFEKETKAWRVEQVEKGHAIWTAITSLDGAENGSQAPHLGRGSRTSQGSGKFPLRTTYHNEEKEDTIHSFIDRDWKVVTLSNSLIVQWDDF